MQGKNGLTYRDAGVDIDAGNALVTRIKPLVKATRRVGADADIGGFGGLFDLKACGFKDPVLCAANDGVGTKLAVAIEAGIHGTVGIDLVAMSVNDLVVQGAEPLFFLDYFATGRLSVDTATEVVAGIADGCKQAGCALIGGETAEMPGMYKDGDYDLAGFAVGAAERGDILPRPTVTSGDVILGIASSGVHSNGFSLVRKIVTHSGLGYADAAPFAPGKTLGEALLEPTRIYTKDCLALAAETQVRTFCHVTGGGLAGNLERVMPNGLVAELDRGTWTPAPVFGLIAQRGRIVRAEMERTFNMGVGMVAVVAPEDTDRALAILTARHLNCWTLGTVNKGTKDGPRATLVGQHPRF